MNTYQPSYLKAPNYRIHLEYDLHFDSEAVKFINFLKSAAERREIRLKYERTKDGRLILVIPKDKGGNFDVLLQEMILSSGLFYYAMTLDKQRSKIIDEVIEPIYRSLIEERFMNTHWRHIAEHIRGTLGPGEFVPTDTDNEFSKAYEVLYRKWILDMADNSEFIREVDALATKFLLNEIQHSQGARSPQFNVLLSRANRKGIGMDREFRKALEKIHHWRTTSLHRLNDLDQEEIASAASHIFIFFQYFNEFSESQDVRRLLLHGEWYDREKYGEEEWLDENGGIYDYSDVVKSPCHDCGAVKDQFHCQGCDAERCPRCKGQLLSCECCTDEDIEYYESLEGEDDGKERVQ